MAEPLGELVRTHYCGELRESHVGRTVTVMGWAATRRDLGGVIFIDLRDREGLCQVVARAEASEQAHAVANEVRSEYVVAVVGEVEARDAETVNPNLETGKVEVLAREIRILSEAKTPVFPIEDGIDTHEEVRLKHRYLDLRRPQHAEEPAAAPPGDDGGAALPGRAGLLRDRDADARQVDARGRARLPGARRASTTAASTRCRSRRSSSSSC